MLTVYFAGNSKKISALSFSKIIKKCSQAKAVKCATSCEARSLHPAKHHEFHQIKPLHFDQLTSIVHETPRQSTSQ